MGEQKAQPKTFNPGTICVRDKEVASATRFASFFGQQHTLKV